MLAAAMWDGMLLAVWIALGAASLNSPGTRGEVRAQLAIRTDGWASISWESYGSLLPNGIL